MNYLIYKIRIPFVVWPLLFPLESPLGLHDKSTRSTCSVFPPCATSPLFGTVPLFYHNFSLIWPHRFKGRRVISVARLYTTYEQQNNAAKCDSSMYMTLRPFKSLPTAHPSAAPQIYDSPGLPSPRSSQASPPARGGVPPSRGPINVPAPLVPALLPHWPLCLGHHHLGVAT